MIELPALVNGVICGLVLIVFGAVPGLLQAVVDGVQQFSRELRRDRGAVGANVHVGEQPF